MGRVERLALQLASSGRAAQPIDQPGHDDRRKIRPPIKEVGHASHTYRDTDDLVDDDEEFERDDKSVLLFGDDDRDDLDDFDEEDETQGSRDTLRKSRLKLL